VSSRLKATELHPVVTSDGSELRLTRYRAGDKGPVVLAPGYGNSARAFALETVKTNFVEFLAEHGYDVWLFDYRASPDLAASRQQFTVDDIAQSDYPAAIAAIRGESGAESVQVMAHCVGSMSLVMSLAAGLDGVRSAVCSQLGAHPIPTLANRLRARIRLASLLKGVGIDGLSTDFDSSRLDDRMLDALMRAAPSKHHCDNPVCRRIAFIYGDVYDHSHLNSATHEAIGGIFGISNMTFFEHVSRMVRAERVVDSNGMDTYLEHLDRVRLPITFIHGENNRMFVPESTEITYRLLCAANGSELYARHVIPGYAHLDCWLGAHADEDVFPIALEALEKHN
jgi:choline dehydrogenase-like flavoprotein